MKQEELKALSDEELAKMVSAGQEEQKARAERKKRETITRIRELAASVGVSVQIGGQRGRTKPEKAVTDGR